MRLKEAFVSMAALAFACRAAVLILAAASVSAPAAEADPHAPPKPLCLSAADTRDEIKAHKLLEPFAALKSAAQQRKAEALSAKLCHAGDEFVYEITLLHRDGRLMRVQMEAGTGKLIARAPHEQHEAPVAREPHEPHEAPVAREPHEIPAAREQSHETPIKN